MKQAHVFISGDVQGVGFRQFIKSNARKLGINGWVRNTEDGGVEAVYQSPSTNDEEPTLVLQMIELSKKGPFLSDVKHFGFEWEDTETIYNDFTSK